MNKKMQFEKFTELIDFALEIILEYKTEESYPLDAIETFYYADATIDTVIQVTEITLDEVNDYLRSKVNMDYEMLQQFFEDFQRDEWEYIYD